MSQSNLSPRRIKPATVTMLFELRAMRSHPPAAYLSRFEAKVRGWRGLQRWSMQVHTSARGETVLQVIAEKAAQCSRVDNAFSSWRRLLQQLLPIAKASAAAAPAKARAAWPRGSWIAGDGQHSASSWYADVKFLAEAYDAACAKLWDEARRIDVGATRCSHLEPALPEPPRRALLEATRVQGGVVAASSGKLPPKSVTAAGARTSSSTSSTSDNRGFEVKSS